MPIALSCPTCRARVKAPDAAVGHTLKCPACKKPVPVAAPPPAPEARANGAPAGANKGKPPAAADDVYEDFEVVDEKSADDDVEQDFEVVEDEAPAEGGLAVIKHFERVADHAAAGVTRVEVLEDADGVEEAELAEEADEVAEAELVEDAADVLEVVEEAQEDEPAPRPRPRRRRPQPG